MTMRICEYCGTSFEILSRHLRKGGGKGRFCSQACRARIAARKPIEERFFARIHKLSGADACWLWTGAPTAYGYGTISVEGTITPAHRLSYVLHHGSIPEGLFILHKCPKGENRLCVNPDHLALGTNQDNVDDKVFWNRQAHLPKKLTEHDIHVIRQQAALGHSYRSIGRKFAVTHHTIEAIVTRRTWAHIP